MRVIFYAEPASLTPEKIEPKTRVDFESQVCFRDLGCFEHEGEGPFEECSFEEKNWGLHDCCCVCAFVT